jgi:trehalose 6-phosphate synthase/phosphatase
VQRWIDKENFDFILAIGDDSTDEDMFAVLPDWAYSFRVGGNRTQARFRLGEPAEVLEFLRALTDTADDNTDKAQETKTAKPNSDIQRI